MRPLFLTLFILAGGCTQPPASFTPDLVNAHKGLAGVVAHVDAADKLVGTAEPLASPAAKPILATARGQLGKALDAAVGVDADIGRLGADLRSQSDQIASLGGKLSHLEAQWYVKLGQWVERLAWLALAYVLCVNLGGFALSRWGGPLTLVGTFLLHLPGASLARGLAMR